MTSRTGAGAPDVTSVITTTHLVVIVILAIAAVLVIWWGGRSRREQRRAIHEAEERRLDADQPESKPVEIAPAAPEPAAQRIDTPPVPAPPPPLAEAPLAAPAPPAAVDAPATGLPVTTLKGLGPKVGARLAELGVTSVDQLAALSPADAAALDAQLGAFSGRIARDRWIEQAQLLAAGDKAGFEAQFGKLG